MNLPKNHPFTIIRQSYSTPSKGWVCLKRPVELAGLAGEYGYSPRLWLVQSLVEQAKELADENRQCRTIKLAERVMQQLNRKVIPDPQREKLYESLYGSLPVVPKPALRQAA